MRQKIYKTQKRETFNKTSQKLWKIFFGNVSFRNSEITTDAFNTNAGTAWMGFQGSSASNENINSCCNF